MASIQIEQLTVTEKIQFMESLWDSLCAHSEDILPPAWHGKVLEDREEDLKSQADGFMDWEEAKLLIRKQIS